MYAGVSVGVGVGGKATKDKQAAGVEERKAARRVRTK